MLCVLTQSSSCLAWDRTDSQRGNSIAFPHGCTSYSAPSVHTLPGPCVTKPPNNNQYPNLGYIVKLFSFLHTLGLLLGSQCHISYPIPTSGWTDSDGRSPFVLGGSGYFSQLFLSRKIRAGNFKLCFVSTSALRLFAVCRLCRRCGAAQMTMYCLNSF